MSYFVRGRTKNKHRKHTTWNLDIFIQQPASLHTFFLFLFYFEKIKAK